MGPEATLWYALHVRPNSERYVQKMLEGHGIEEFTPTWKPRAQVRVEKPLFPGYVFSRFALSSSRIAILHIPWVLRILGYRVDQPEPIPDSEILSVRQMLESGIPIEPIAYQFPEVGKRVRIIRGPLKDVEGYVAYVRNRMRVIISVEMLHRSISTEVNSEWLQPVK